MKKSYVIFVHFLNWLLLAGIGFVALALIINISDPSGIGKYEDLLKFLYLNFLLVMWAFNYWYQFKKRKWFVPIVGTILYVVIALFVLAVVIPFISEIIH